MPEKKPTCEELLEQLQEARREIEALRRRPDASLSDTAIGALDQNTILESITDAFFTLDSNMVFTSFNRAAEMQMGREAAHVIGEKFDEVFPEAAGSIFDQNYKRAIQKQETMQFETYFDLEPYKNWYEVRVYPTPDGGIAVYFLITTSRHERLEKLHTQQMMMDQIQDWVTMTNLEGIITYVNKAQCDALGKRPEDLTGKPIAAFGEDPDAGATQQEIMETTLAEGHWSGEVVNFDNKGNPLTLHCRTQIIRNDIGEPVTLCGISTDITDRKRTEKLLKRNQQNLERTEQLAGIGSWQWNVDEDKVTWSKNLYTLFHFDPDLPPPPFEGQAKFYSPDSFEKLRVAVWDCVKNGKPYDMKLQGPPKGGTSVIYRVTGNPEFDANGKITRLYGYVQDITRRIKAQADYQRIFNMATELICVADLNTATFIEINPAATQILGYSREELLSQPFVNFIHPDDIASTQNTIEKELLKGKEIVSFTNRYRTKSGDYRYFDWDSHPVAEEGITYAIAHDVTDRELARQALHEKEEQYRNLAENTEAILWEFDTIEDRWLYVAPQVKRMLGYDPAEWADMKFWEERIHEDDREHAALYCAQCVADGIDHEFEYLFYKKNGDVVWLRDSVSVEMREGRPFRLRGFMVDITHQKESEEKYENLFTQMLDGFAVHEIICDDNNKPVDYRFLSVNPAFEKMTGLKSEDIIGKTVLEALPETESVWIERFGQVALTGEPQHFQQSSHAIGRTYEVSAFQPLPGQFATIIKDVSDEIESRRERERLMLAIEQADETVIISDANGIIEYVNPAFEKFSGYRSDEVLGEHISLIQSGEHEKEFYENLWNTIQRGEVWDGRCINRRKDGSLHTELVTISPIRDQNGQIINFVSVQRDISREMELEEQYRQAQKMEAIGQLTGGVAHDFNNLLQVICAANELAMDDLEPEHPAMESLHEVMKAGDRATTLVSQLLAFSRRQIMRMEVLDLNNVIDNLVKMVGRLIGETIKLEWIPGHGLGFVSADRGMVEQVLMNLAVNARDAMQHEGTLTIETQNLLIDSEYCANHTWAEPGRFVMLSISDTGCGIDEETLQHVFEPFYTTKEVGKGTGLGLATVYGIVRQHNGMINVYSEPGSGTTFKIYLPISQRPATSVGPMVEKPIEGGNETILIAEDDEIVRNLARRILKRAGYNVLVAQDGVEACEIFQENINEISLVLLDVVMPRMSGRKALEKMQELRFGIIALFCSGYSENAIHTNFILEEGLQLIPKPYAPKDLLKFVRRALDKNDD